MSDLHKELKIVKNDIDRLHHTTAMGFGGLQEVTLASLIEEMIDLKIKLAEGETK